MVDSHADTTTSSAKRVKIANGQTAPEGLWKAKRFAVKFQPPCILLEYEDSSLKKRVRQVKLTRVPADVDVDRFTRKVIRSFPRQLDPASVKYDQVRKLVVKLLESMQQTQLASSDAPEPQAQQQQAAASSGKPAANVLKILKLESLGGVSPSTPKLMPCLSPSIPLPGSERHAPHANNQSIESTDRFSTSTFGGYGRESKEELDLDDLDNALDELDRELGGASKPSALHVANGSTSAAGTAPNGAHTAPAASGRQQQTKAPAVSAAPAATPSTPSEDAKKTRFAQEETEDCLVLEVDIQGHVDLNKVTDVELKMAKKQMEEDFLKNQLKPGHPEFEYDKQVEFAPATETNDWDESGDEEEEEEVEAQPASQAVPSSKAGAGLRIQVNADEEDDDEEDEDEDAAGGRRVSDDTSPQSVRDDVSPNRVAIDTDSDLDLDLP